MAKPTVGLRGLVEPRVRHGEIMGNEIDKNALSDLLAGLADSFKKERQETEPYKELFKAGSTYTGLLRDLEIKMTRHVLDACEILTERHGKKINKNQFNFLLALPLLTRIAEQDAENNEGAACCVDKAYFILSEQLKALADA